MMKIAEYILCFSAEPLPVTSQMKTFRDTKESFISICWLNCNAAMQPWSWEQSSVWRNIEAASSLCHFTSRWWIQCSPFHVTYTAFLTILKASYWHQLLTRIECPLYNLLLSATSKIFRLVLFHLWRDWHDWSWYSLFSNNGWLVCHI